MKPDRIRIIGIKLLIIEGNNTKKAKMFIRAKDDEKFYIPDLSSYLVKFMDYSESKEFYYESALGSLITITTCGKLSEYEKIISQKILKPDEKYWISNDGIFRTKKGLCIHLHIK